MGRATRHDLFYWVTPAHRQIGRWIDGFFNRFFVDAMITNSDACRQAALDSERPAPRQIVVIENGIDLRKFDEITFPPPFAHVGTPACVGAVAMLRPEKRLDIIIEAAGILRTADAMCASRSRERDRCGKCWKPGSVRWVL